MRQARSGSSSNVAPAPVFVTFFTGQPKLTSTMSAPAAATIRAASLITSGSEPKSWIARGCSSDATRRYPRVRSLRCSMPAQLTISEQTRPAPKRRPCRRKACTLTPAMGARTRRVGISISPIAQVSRRSIAMAQMLALAMRDRRPRDDRARCRHRAGDTRPGTGSPGSTRAQDSLRAVVHDRYHALPAWRRSAALCFFPNHTEAWWLQ